jgi:hypothetical protein
MVIARAYRPVRRNQRMSVLTFLPSVRIQGMISICGPSRSVAQRSLLDRFLPARKESSL